MNANKAKRAVNRFFLFFLNVTARSACVAKPWPKLSRRN